MVKMLPFGRVNEFLSTLSDEQRQRTSIRHSIRLGGDSTVKVWRTRQAMARAIRKDERTAPYSHWSALVKLGDGEGY